MTAAETLRRAAQAMREKAQGATQTCYRNDRGRLVPIDAPRGHTLAGAERSSGILRTIEDAEHFASWPPTVALAVAELLSFAAETWSEDDECRSPVGPDESCGECANCDHRWMRDRLLAVAHAYLGETP